MVKKEGEKLYVVCLIHDAKEITDIALSKKKEAERVKHSITNTIYCSSMQR